MMPKNGDQSLWDLSPALVLASSCPYRGAPYGPDTLLGQSGQLTSFGHGGQRQAQLPMLVRIAPLSYRRSSPIPLLLAWQEVWPLAHQDTGRCRGPREASTWIEGRCAQLPCRTVSTSCHRRFGLRGISRISNPSSPNAFSTACANSAPVGIAPASPAPLVPKGFKGDSVSS